MVVSPECRWVFQCDISIRYFRLPSIVPGTSVCRTWNFQPHLEFQATLEPDYRQKVVYELHHIYFYWTVTGKLCSLFGGGGGGVINPSIFLNHLSMNGQILRQISYISNVLYLKLVLESIDIVDIGWRSAWWSLWNDKNRYYTDRIIVIMSYVYNSNQILWEQIFKLTLRVVTRTT